MVFIVRQRRGRFLGCPQKERKYCRADHDEGRIGEDDLFLLHGNLILRYQIAALHGHGSIQSGVGKIRPAPASRHLPIVVREIWRADKVLRIT